MEDYKKKYEEALERAKIVNPGTTDYNIVTEIFPELKESEDERIRKQLLNWFKDCNWDAIDNETLKRDDIIAWLEKQGEQKPKFRVGDTIKCKYDDRQFTIKSVDLDKGTYTYTQEGCGNDIDYADEEFELVEQNPAWSEEDEKIFNLIIQDYEAALKSFCGHKGKLDWLKSPKDRVQPQTQPEWSKEDEKINRVLNCPFLCLPPL